MVRAPRALWPVLIPLFALAPAGCNLSGLGPPEDHSAFVSARLVGEGRAVVFAYNRFVYRPAVGWRAFPDGGVPRYLVDRQIIGLFDLETQETRVWHREDNRDWQPGNGDYFILAASGWTVLLASGGQRRRGFGFERRYHWLDAATGVLEPFPLEEELARHGRGPGYYYLLKPDRTLAAVTPALGTPVGEHWSRDPAKAQMWLRRSDGAYVKLGDGVEFYGSHGDEVGYWDLADRAVKFYDLRTGAVRTSPKPPPPRDDRVQAEAAVADGGRRLVLRTRAGEGWRTEELPIEMDLLNER